MSACPEIDAPPSIPAGRVGLASAVYEAGDIASLLKISERQVWKLRDAGHLPECIRIGRLVRWSRQAIDRWIEEGCPRPGE
jgi:excisionase family DNA binding protein